MIKELLSATQGQSPCHPHHPLLFHQDTGFWDASPFSLSAILQQCAEKLGVRPKFSSFHSFCLNFCGLYMHLWHPPSPTLISPVFPSHLSPEDLILLMLLFNSGLGFLSVWGVFLWLLLMLMFILLLPVSMFFLKRQEDSELHKHHRDIHLYLPPLGDTAKHFILKAARFHYRYHTLGHQNNGWWSKARKDRKKKTELFRGNSINT